MAVSRKPIGIYCTCQYISIGYLSVCHRERASASHIIQTVHSSIPVCLTWVVHNSGKFVAHKRQFWS